MHARTHTLDGWIYRFYLLLLFSRFSLNVSKNNQFMHFLVFVFTNFIVSRVVRVHNRRERESERIQNYHLNFSWVYLCCGRHHQALQFISASDVNKCAGTTCTHSRARTYTRYEFIDMLLCVGNWCANQYDAVVTLTQSRSRALIHTHKVLPFLFRNYKKKYKI